jgi:hypothetical protein
MFSSTNPTVYCSQASDNHEVSGLGSADACMYIANAGQVNGWVWIGFRCRY